LRLGSKSSALGIELALSPSSGAAKRQKSPAARDRLAPLAWVAGGEILACSWLATREARLFALIENTVYNYSMQTEIQYRWRILWAGKWRTTSHHCTEEQIRKDHPEAVRIDASRRELKVAETFEERTHVMFRV